VTEPLTKDLPLTVVESLAQAWVTAIACERSLAGQPKDNLPESLWQNDFITPDLADAGSDAFFSLSPDLGYSLVFKTANQALICPECLTRIIWGEEEEGE